MTLAILFVKLLLASWYFVAATLDLISDFVPWTSRLKRFVEKDYYHYFDDQDNPR